MLLPRGAQPGRCRGHPSHELAMTWPCWFRARSTTFSCVGCSATESLLGWSIYTATSAYDPRSPMLTTRTFGERGTLAVASGIPEGHGVGREPLLTWRLISSRWCRTAWMGGWVAWLPAPGRGRGSGACIRAGSAGECFLGRGGIPWKDSPGPSRGTRSRSSLLADGRPGWLGCARRSAMRLVAGRGFSVLGMHQFFWK